MSQLSINGYVAGNTLLVKAKISVSSLEIGMHVVELDRPWTDLPFALQGLYLNDEFEIQTLQRYCKFVFIEHDYTRPSATNTKVQNEKPQEIETIDFDSAREALTTEAPLKVTSNSFKTKGLQPKSTIEHELPRAKHVYKEAKKHIQSIFASIEPNQKIDVSKSKIVVNQCVSSIVSNANALFWLTRIQEVSNVEANHSLRVCILSLALGHYLGLEGKQLEQLGIAALLHDIGKTRIPHEIINKRSEYTKVEKRVMQKHTTLGYDLLNADTSLEPIITEVALHHHQHIDGNGYPAQTIKGSLSIFTKIVAISDAYDDMTNAISKKQSISPRLALKELYQQMSKQFDIGLTKAFIKMIGIYPAGSLVKMTNGEVGMVVSVDSKFKLTPKVEMIFDANGNMVPPLIINLKAMVKDSYGFPYKIEGSLPDGTLGMDMKQFIADRLNIASF